MSPKQQGFSLASYWLTVTKESLLLVLSPVLTIHIVPLPLVWLPLNLVIDLHRVVLLSRAKSSIVLHCSGIKVK